MIDMMIKKNGDCVEIGPYKWIYTTDGLPVAPDDRDNPRAFYVRLVNGRTETAIYKGALLEKWLSEKNTHIILNENDIIAWRFKQPS